MELWQEILSKARSTNTIHSKAPSSISDVLNSSCYQALKKIKEILANDDLSDAECFSKIEEIVLVFEDLGSDAGNRHDFG